MSSYNLQPTTSNPCLHEGGDSASSLLSWLFKQQHSGISLGLERMQALLEALARKFHTDPATACETLMDTASGSDCSSGGMEHTAVVATHRLPFLHQDSRRLATNQYEICGLEDPHDRIPCFHIAGTNGKGSVSAFAASILKAAGLRVGLYTSPHLVDFRERIQINGEMISQEDLEKGIKRLQAATQTGKEMPTFFELTTALAFDYFARQQCDVIVLETGLGGRLDATNVASNKIACAITPISMDHQALLGSTLSAIAREKAGIIRAGIPVVTSPQPEEVMNVLQEKAKQLYAPLEIISEPISPEIPLGLLGSYQRWNAAVALALVQQGPWKLSPEAIAEGLATTSWPGRFQRWKTKNGQEMILDGAHNPAAAEQLVATWKEVFPGQKCELIFGALADKEGEAMLRILEPISASINLVSVHSPRTSSPAELQKILPLATTFSSLEEVFKKKKFFVDKIFGFSTDLQPPVLLTGSLFLVGEGLALLQGRSHSSFSQ